jgi:hypothetical protein
MTRCHLFCWIITFFVATNFFTPACFANSFGIGQAIINSGGTTKRYINISSPWSGAYIYENMQMVGKVEIIETFTMDNMAPGTKSDFDFDFRDNPGSGIAESSDIDTESNSKPETKSKTVSAVKSSAVADPVYIIVDIRPVPRWSDLFLTARQ